MQFLMIAAPAEGVSMEQVKPHIKGEAAKLWEFYSSGQIRTIYSRTDKPGVVAMLEAADLDAAKRAVESLPMVQSKLLHVEVIPLKPYTVFEQAFTG